MPGISPFRFTNPVSTTPGRVIVTKPGMKQIFTNNAQVYYTPGSQSATGIGSVRNTSIRSRKI